MFWRYLLAASVLLLFLRGRVVRDVRRKDALRLMIVGGAGQAVITYLSLYALDFLPVGPLAFLFYTYPAWVALISAALGREELTLMRFIPLSIAMTGIVVMVGMPGEAHLDTFGIILALGTAILYALYLPSLNRAQRGISAGVSSSDASNDRDVGISPGCVTVLDSTCIRLAHSGLARAWAGTHVDHCDDRAFLYCSAWSDSTRSGTHAVDICRRSTDSRCCSLASAHRKRSSSKSNQCVSTRGRFFSISMTRF
jgi:hypothetical protein